MEEILKDKYLCITICLIVILLLLLVILTIWNLLYNKKSVKGRSKEHSEKQNISPLKSDSGGQMKVDQQLECNGVQTADSSNISQNIKKEVPSNIPDPIGQTTNSRTYNYLFEAQGGKFSKLFSSSDKCFFRTWEEGGVRKYEFYGNESKALANINAIFDDVCDIEGKRSGATVIENVSPGTLDSELKITSKAKIKLK